MQKRMANVLMILTMMLMVISGIKSPESVQAASPAQDNRVPIYIFWGDGCPHCARAMAFLQGLQLEYPYIEIRQFEIYFVEENREIFTEMAVRYGFEASSVPTIFIGSEYLTGYTEDYNDYIEGLVVQCMEQGCPDPGSYTLPQEEVSVIQQPTTPLATATPAPTDTPAAGETSTAAAVVVPQHTASPAPTDTAAAPTPDVTASVSAVVAALQNTPAAPDPMHTLNIPLLGSINLDNQSAMLSTLLIAFVDGFNPCSIWVLTMLLALTLHSGSRRRVFLIGLVFLTVTALIYALFIGGLFSVMKIIEFMGWVQVVTALVALVFGIINVKDYFWYKEGVSLTIADEKKPGIYKRMRAVLDAGQSIWGLIGATIVLAAGVSLVEFSCTAGFPVLWVNLLTAQQVGAASFVVLLLLYMLIYQLDELAIFCTAVFSLKASRLEEKHGRLLKLVGGMLMLSLAAVMLINPSLMNSLDTSLLVFAGSFAATLLVLLLHRVILPRWFGVWIGSESK